MLIGQHNGLEDPCTYGNGVVLRPYQADVDGGWQEIVDHSWVTNTILVDNVTQTLNLAAFRRCQRVVLGILRDGEWDPLWPRVTVRQELVDHIKHDPADARSRRARELDLTLIHQSVKVLLLDRHRVCLGVLTAVAAASRSSAMPAMQKSPRACSETWRGTSSLVPPVRLPH